MGLKINIADVPERSRSTKDSGTIQEGGMTIKKVFGKNANLAVYERGRYHTSPHQHTAEQFNYILEGKVWWFVEDEAYLLEPGDFHRVPADAVHWAKSEEPPIKMIEAHSPPLEVGDGDTAGLFADDETPEPNDSSKNLAVDVDGWEEKEAQMMEAYRRDGPGGLTANRDELTGKEISGNTTSLVVGGRSDLKMAYGKDLNLAHVRRGGYHSSPHQHTAEQFNHILEGKVWWFVEDEGFLLGPGDFHRVPANAVHWAKAEEHPIEMVEAHSPPLVGDPGTKEGGRGLYADWETPGPNEESTNEGVDVPNWEEIEAAAIEAYFEAHPAER